ncbi:MAG: hypothetical protein QXM92_00580 [Candidatus Anstonellales archaeon]
MVDEDAALKSRYINKVLRVLISRLDTTTAATPTTNATTTTNAAATPTTSSTHLIHHDINFTKLSKRDLDTLYLVFRLIENDPVSVIAALTTYRVEKGVANLKGILPTLRGLLLPGMAASTPTATAEQ